MKWWSGLALLTLVACTGTCSASEDPLLATLGPPPPDIVRDHHGPALAMAGAAAWPVEPEVWMEVAVLLEQEGLGTARRCRIEPGISGADLHLQRGAGLNLLPPVVIDGDLWDFEAGSWSDHLVDASGRPLATREVDDAGCRIEPVVEHHVAGRLVDRGGRPIVGVHLDVCDGELMTDADGRFDGMVPSFRRRSGPWPARCDVAFADPERRRRLEVEPGSVRVCSPHPCPTEHTVGLPEPHRIDEEFVDRLVYRSAWEDVERALDDVENRHLARRLSGPSARWLTARVRALRARNALR